MMKRIFLISIRLYQHIISLDHGWLKFARPFGQCKFYPTCSEYAYQAIEKYGIRKGVIKSLKRLIRCHPWSLGGHDPVK